MTQMARALRYQLVRCEALIEGMWKEIPIEKIVVTDFFSNENGDKIRPDKAGMDPNFPDQMDVTFTFEDLGEKMTVKGKLMAMGMITHGMPVSFKEFKERASAHKYGKRALYIIFIGEPKHNMFAFYPEISTKKQAIRDAYNMYKRLVNGDLSDIENRDAIWGDSGYPLIYGPIRKTSWGIAGK